MMNRKKLVIGGLSIAVISTALFFALSGKNGKEQYKTEKVTRGDVIETITASGIVNAIKTVQVGTQVSGTIEKIYVDFNSRVKKGQIIARIDPTTLNAQLSLAKANLAAANAAVEKSRVLLSDAKRTMERNQELFKKNLIAQSDLDTAVTNNDSARAQLEQSKAQLEQARASLTISETNLEYTRICSPVSGIVISRAVDVGQTVAASFQTPTLFTIAEDLTKMQIDTSVNEADIGKVKNNFQVTFTVDAYPESTFKGFVSQVRVAPITVSNVVTYDVVIKVDNSDLRLMPGMTANTAIIISKKTDVLKIPNASLRFKMQDKSALPAVTKTDGKNSTVWVLEKGKPKRITVTTGTTDGNYTEITSGGLKDGMDIIIDRVSLVQKKNDTNQRPPRMF